MTAGEQEGRAGCELARLEVGKGPAAAGDDNDSRDRAMPAVRIREEHRVVEQLSLLPVELDGAKPGVVYVMTDGYLLKIGYTTRGIRQRSGELRARVVCFWPGSRADEKAYHAQFARWNVGGEWFRVPDEPGPLSELRLLIQEWGSRKGLRLLDEVIAANLRRASA